MKSSQWYIRGVKGLEAHQTFLTVLQLAGFDVSLVNNNDDDVDDSCENSLFWPAESGGDVGKRS